MKNLFALSLFVSLIILGCAPIQAPTPLVVAATSTSTERPASTPTSTLTPTATEIFTATPGPTTTTPTAPPHVPGTLLFEDFQDNKAQGFKVPPGAHWKIVTES